jgi:hypothetical protein
MKCKKSLAITLVVCLFIAGVTSSAYAGVFMNSSSPKAEISDRGVMRCLDQMVDSRNSATYIIDECEKGTEFAGRIFKRYLPLNLDDFEEFKKDGLKVEFTAKLMINNILSVSGIHSLIRFRALPIILTDIKKIDDVPGPQIKISFEIEPLPIIDAMIPQPVGIDAKLTNNGEDAIIVSEMGLEIKTLNYKITTPDSKTLLFNTSRWIRKLPETVRINPGEIYSVRVDDITEPGLFVDEESNDYIFETGTYQIIGIYESNGAASTANTEIIFEGKLFSEQHELFIIGGYHDSEPENAYIYGRVRQDPLIPATQFIPIEDALVRVYDASIDITPGSGIICETRTNERGEYELNVEPGRYLIIASKEGYTQATELVEVESAEEIFVSFVLRKLFVEPSLTINFEKQEFREGEPIELTVTLTNNGAEALKIQDMGLEYRTLDLIIKTPKNIRIHYIGSTIKGYPPVVELKPGESTEIIIDLTEIELGNEKGPVTLDVQGNYLIIAKYASVNNPETDNDFWQGSLISQIKHFSII